MRCRTFFALAMMMSCSFQQSFAEDRPEFRIENENLRLVVSSHGAEAQSVYGVRSGIEYLWQGDPQFWSSRSPILFPILGRVKEGKYSWRGETYSITIPHGFAKNSPFELERREAARLQFLLKSSAETKKQYPFDFQLRIEYVLEETSLVTRFHVTNTGSQPMPFSWGGHPGFRVPLSAGEKFEDYRLDFATEESPERHLIEGVFVSGKTTPFALKDGRSIPLKHQIFDDEAILLQNIKNRKVFLVGPGDRRRWSVEFDDFEFIAFWQPQKTESPFVCLEPWSGLPDLFDKTISELDEKIGMKTLPPGGSAEAKTKFTLLD
jgi:galactose mutarotase-like enzyme